MDDNLIKRLLSEERRSWEDPEKFLPELIMRDDVVADVGCGPGYYARVLVRLSKMVYCIDKNEKMLNYAAGINSPNILFLKDISELPNNSVSVVLFANSFHDMDRKNMYKETIRVLNSKGRVIIVDWKKESPMGPPSDIRMSKDEYIKTFSLDFRLDREFEVGPYHIGLVFVRK
ncbi:SAM-dependent methyltransferase [Sulfolobales archaeon HS-7]|nr:SAM-dependent methyltransferase [Sulfolobales archaeon HS-7]